MTTGRGTKASSAAFKALVLNDQGLAGQVADYLTRQINHADTKFADRNRWCVNSGVGYRQGPMHVLADWMQGLINAYLFLDAMDITVPGFAVWARDFGRWQTARFDGTIDQFFVDHKAGNYTPKGTSWDDSMGPVYQGGPQKLFLHERVSDNKPARSARTAVCAGLISGDAVLVTDAKRILMETLQFGYYPADGSFSEFDRSEADDAARGWKYAIECFGSYAFAVHLLARSGDTDLLEPITGGQGASAGAKSIEKAVTDLAKYVTGVPGGYNRKTNQGDPLNSGNRISEVEMLPLLPYMDDPSTLTRAYKERTFPANIQIGSYSSVNGTGGSLPGALLMYG